MAILHDKKTTENSTGGKFDTVSQKNALQQNVALNKPKGNNSK